MITIVNYGLGNLGSIQNMLRKLGAKSIISDKEEDIASASKLILPGVGAFDSGMKQLQDSNLIEILHKKALEEKIPVLGICLGVQLMTNGSEEGSLPGLGWFDADTVAFDFEANQISGKFTIPHMGWNHVHLAKDSGIAQELYDDERYYFVHSFHLKPKNQEDILFSTQYGYKFASALERNNLIGCQFHPEKSHKYGMRLLRGFIKNY